MIRRRRAVSCREVVTAARAQLDAVNPRINSVVHLGLEAAAAIEARALMATPIDPR